jgi:hypothetical protein
MHNDRSIKQGGCEKLCARCAVVHEEFRETPTNGQKYNPEDKPGNCGGTEFLDETVRQTEHERRRDKEKKVESEDIQGPLKNDDVDNPEEDREYADEYNGMGHCRADIMKDPSGKNKEEATDGSFCGLTTRTTTRRVLGSQFLTIYNL